MRPRLGALAGTRCPARNPGGPAGGACVLRPAETPDRSGQLQQLYPLWAGALGVLTIRLSCRGAPQKEGDKEQRDPVGSRGLWPCHGHRSYGAGVCAERSLWSVQAEGSVWRSPGRRIQAAGIRQCDPGRKRKMDRRLQAAGSQSEVQTDRQRDWCSGVQAEKFRQRDPGSRIRAAAPGGRAARRGSGRAAPGAGDGRVRRSRGRRASGGRGLVPEREREQERERANQRASEGSEREEAAEGRSGGSLAPRP